MKQAIILGLCVAALAIGADEKRRVFITQSQSWEQKGRNGGARPQTAEILKTFGERCGAITITNNRERADFTVTLDHEGGKGWAQRDNKVAVFTKDGDMIHSSSTRSVGTAVKNACEAIVRGQ